MKSLASAFVLILLAMSPVRGTCFATEGAAAPDPGRQAQLRQILRQNCTVCHGKSLQGDIGPPLSRNNLAGKDEGLLVTTILEGRDGTAMPAWGAMIKESEARWLLHLLRNGGQ